MHQTWGGRTFLGPESADETEVKRTNGRNSETESAGDAAQEQQRRTVSSGPAHYLLPPPRLSRPPIRRPNDRPLLVGGLGARPLATAGGWWSTLGLPRASWGAAVGCGTDTSAPRPSSICMESLIALVTMSSLPGDRSDVPLLSSSKRALTLGICRHSNPDAQSAPARMLG